MTDRELYNVYCEMFKNARAFEERLRNALEKKGYNVYCVYMAVGDEETRKYFVDIEYSNGTAETYRHIRDNITEDRLVQYIENKERECA